MKIDYEANFKGFMSIPRCVQLLIPQENLSLAEFGAYVCLILQADFDNRHKNFGVIIRDDQELAEKLKLSPSTIYRHRKSLIDKGLLVTENENTRFPNFSAFNTSLLQTIAGGSPKLNVAILKLNNQLSKTEPPIAKTQSNQDQNNPQSSNISSKDNLNSSTVTDTQYEDMLS